MARKTKKAAKKPDLPSRDEVLAFVADNPDKANKRDIARAFGIKGAARIPLKRMLREMLDEGVIAGSRKAIHTPGTLPPVLVADVSGRDADGELLAEPAERHVTENGDAPRIVVMPDRGKNRRPAPGVGDRVLLRVDEAERTNPSGPYTATVIRILDRPQRTALGVYREGSDGNGRVQSVDKKARSEWAVPQTQSKDAREGDLVSVEPLRGRVLGLPQARVVSVVGSMQDEHAISLIAAETHGIPIDFPKDAIAQAEAAPADVSLKGLEDLRKLPFITIDPADARDHDDAVYAHGDDNPDNPGGHVVWVAIADVARYVPVNTALDRAARERGNSVYFPGRVVPMLPKRLSNDLCSLRAGENRPSLAVRMVFDAGGAKKSHRFARVMIRCTEGLSYETAQAAIDGRPAPKDAKGDASTVLEPVLKPLWAAWKSILKAQEKRAPLDLDLPERKLVLDKRGRVKRVVVPPRLEAHRLIETMMIMANVAAAETLEKTKTPLLYRVHDAPALEKMDSLRDFLSSLDISMPKAGNLRPQHFNDILARVESTPDAQLVNEVVLRSQSQAEYSPDNFGHFGLNLRRYAHFTSPIRRYADLVVHRALIAACKLGKDGHMAEPEPLAETAAHISMTERRAMAAERETVDRLIAHFLADKVGTRFNGRISGVTRAGMFVKLDDTGADGFIPAASIDGDYWRYDEAGRQLVSDRTGEAFRLGDDVEVRLVEAIPVAGAMRFEILSDGRKLNASERRQVKGRTQGKRRDPGRRRAAIRRRR